LKKYFANIVLFFLLTGNSFSQISPPGLGKAKTAGWFAIGIRQELDTVDGKGWQSMTYFGIGRKSNPDNYNLLHKQAIWVLNQEFYHQFHNVWQYSFALSYRRQDEYLDNPPYGHDTPRLNQEFRAYGRLSCIFSTPRIKLVPTLRQEFRKFYSPGFKNVNENFQLRSRFRLQLTVNIDRKKVHRLIAGSEQLFSISQETLPGKWTDFKYRESRFSLYYSYSPKTYPFILSIGYMNNLIGVKNPCDVHYLAFDIVIENPFKLQKRSKENIKENFE